MRASAASMPRVNSAGPFRYCWRSGACRRRWFPSARFRQSTRRLGQGRSTRGYLPVDLRFLGENEFGLNAIAGLPVGAGGIVTTRRLIVANRDLVAQFVPGVRRYHCAVSRRSRRCRPSCLQRYLQIDDRNRWSRCLPITPAVSGRRRDRPSFRNRAIESHGFAEVPGGQHDQA